MKTNQRTWVGLVVLLVGAFFLRFIQLSSNPPGFFRDEADKGYTTYCLLETGQDQAGKHWPWYVKAMNVTTSALYQYVDMPFIAGMGLTELAVRLPACLAGTASVGIAFLLARSLWGNTGGLWAGLFVCLSPWSLLLSRWANQSILLTVSVPLGVYFFICEKERIFPSIRFAILSGLCFLLAIYTYEPAQLFVPVFVVLLWCVSLSRPALSQEKRKWFLVSMMVFFVVFALGCIPMILHLINQPAESSARFSRITIFDGQPLASALLEWGRNYILHFSPWFLFLRGDENLRHSTALLGQLHLYLLPLLIMGGIQAMKRRTRIDRILLIWLFCFPIAAACTRERVPHALRSIFGVPAFQMLAVYGLVSWREWRERLQTWFSGGVIRLGQLTWLVMLILCPIVYLSDLFFRYPNYAAVEWEYGYREAIDWWKTHRAEADLTVVSGMAEYPYVFFLFYDRYPPDRWINDQRIENVEFVPTGKATQSVLPPEQGRVLYLLRQDEIPMAMSEKQIQIPTGEAIWKWVAWGTRQGEKP